MRNAIEVTATANHRNRTFTIRTFQDRKLISKYRTIQMNKEEFESCLNNTENDWKHFLKSSDYYSVK